MVLVPVVSVPVALVVLAEPPGLVAVGTSTKNQLSIQNYRTSVNPLRFAPGLRLIRMIGDVEGLDLGLGLGLGGITCATVAVVSRIESKAVNATECNQGSEFECDRTHLYTCRNPRSAKSFTQEHPKKS